MLDNTDLARLQGGLVKELRLDTNPARLTIVVERPDSEQPQTIEVYPGITFLTEMGSAGVKMEMKPDLMLLSPDAPQPVQLEPEPEYKSGEW